MVLLTVDRVAARRIWAQFHDELIRMPPTTREHLLQKIKKIDESIGKGLEEILKEQHLLP